MPAESEAIETTEVVDVAVRKRRRRWPIVLVVIAVVLIVLVVVADFIARSYAEKAIADQARTALDVPASTPLDVQIGPGSVLLQLARREFDQVRVESTGLSIGALRGDALLTVDGLHFGDPAALDSARLTFSTDQRGLSSLISGLTNDQDLPVTISAVTIAKGSVELATELPVFGAKIPAAIAVAPGAKNGQLTLTPTSFSLSGATFTPSDVSKNLGSIGTELAQTRTICVANQLPDGFRLESLRVKAKKLVLGVTAKSVVLGPDLFQSKGTCP